MLYYINIQITYFYIYNINPWLKNHDFKNGCWIGIGFHQNYYAVQLFKIFYMADTVYQGYKKFFKTKLQLNKEINGWKWKH